MKRTTKLIFVLYVFNLFLIGFMIGITFVKQNSIVEHSPKFKDSAIHDQSLPPLDRLKVFTIRLQNASSLTVCSLYHRWSWLVNYPKKKVLHSRTAMVSTKPTNFQRITVDQSKVVSIPITNLTNHEVALNSVIPDPAEPSRLSSNNEKIIVAPQPVSDRPDPFLTLDEKFQTKTKPPVEQKSKITGRAKITDKSQIAEKPKSDPNYKALEIPQLAQNIEKPSSKIVRTCHLRGVVIGNTPIAYVEDQNGYHKVAIGDSFAEGKIVEITANSLTIQIDSEPVVLKMEGLK